MACVPASSSLLVISLAAALGCVTMRRNADYQDGIRIWQTAVLAVPGNSRAHNNLAIEFQACGAHDLAIHHYEEALRIDPYNAHAHGNLGAALATLGRVDEAIPHFRRALQIRPEMHQVQLNLDMAMGERMRDEG